MHVSGTTQPAYTLLGSSRHTLLELAGPARVEWLSLLEVAVPAEVYMLHLLDMIDLTMAGRSVTFLLVLFCLTTGQKDVWALFDRRTTKVTHLAMNSVHVTSWDANLRPSWSQ